MKNLKKIVFVALLAVVFFSCSGDNEEINPSVGSQLSVELINCFLIYFFK